MGCCQSSEEKEVLRHPADPAPYTPSKAPSSTFKPTTSAPNTRKQKGSKKASKGGSHGAGDEHRSIQSTDRSSVHSQESQTSRGSSFQSKESTPGRTQTQELGTPPLQEVRRRTRKGRGKKNAEAEALLGGGGGGGAQQHQQEADEIPRDILPDYMKRKSIQEFFMETRWDREQADELKALFDFCDMDGDGEIGREELQTMFFQMSVQTTPEEFDDLFLSLDIDNSGTISFREFLNGIRWLQKGATMERKLRVKTREPSEEEEFEAQQLHKRVEVYSQYVGLLTQNGAEEVEQQLQQGNLDTAEFLLGLLDLKILRDFQSMLEATTPSSEVLNETTADKIRRLNIELKKARRKN